MSAELDFEAVVIGAGFAGLRMLHECRQLGLSVRVLEAGTDIGGTWYWNRYPGARTDTESWAYCFRFDQELLDEWELVERFPSQPQVHKYLTAVATKHDMFSDIQFSTRVTSAHWDDEDNTWTVGTGTGESIRCRWLISGSGLLSTPLEIPFPGKEKFQGEIYMSNRWPKEEVSFSGKRVAVVGTGASAVQIIPEVAQVAAHLTVFQRTPNYVMPGRNHLVGERQREWIRNNHSYLWDLCETQVFAFPWTTENRFWNDTPPEKRERILDRGWEQGGFQFAFKTFDDMLVVKECNDAASEFVRNKIRAIVDDPETAENLCPNDHPIGSKRPPLGHFYYETYNRPNVSLVPVKDNPIAEITATGREAGGRHRARGRHDHLRPRVRRGHRCADGARHPRPRRRDDPGALGRGRRDLPGRRRRRVPEPVLDHRAADLVHQHPADHREAGHLHRPGDRAGTLDGQRGGRGPARSGEGVGRNV